MIQWWKVRRWFRDLRRRLIMGAAYAHAYEARRAEAIAQHEEVLARSRYWLWCWGYGPDDPTPYASRQEHWDFVQARIKEYPECYDEVHNL